jgi:hypothetical protein
MSQYNKTTYDNMCHCWLVQIRDNNTGSFKEIKEKLTLLSVTERHYFRIIISLPVAEISQWSGSLLYWVKIHSSRSMYG